MSRVRPVSAALLALSLAALAGCTNAAGAVRENGPTSTATPSATAKSRPPVLPQVQPSKPPTQPGNSSFELASKGPCPTDWICRPLGKVTSVSGNEEFQKGDRALRVNLPAGRKAARAAFRSVPVPIVPERTYVASYWRKVTKGGAQGQDSIRLRFFDSRGKLIGTKASRENQAKVGTWTGMDVEVDAPRNARSLEMEIQAKGVGRTVWLDSVALRSRPILEMWGGTGLRRDQKSDTMTLQMATPTAGGIHIRTLEVSGQVLTVIDRSHVRAGDGTLYTYKLAGPASFDDKTKLIVVSPGDAGTIVVTGGRFKVTAGTGFQRLLIGDPVAPAQFPALVVSRNIKEAALLESVPTRFKIRNALDKLAAYLDTRRSKDGGWAVSHAKWPGVLRSDPQAIGLLTSGYLDAFQATGQKVYDDRAKRGLSWLLANQKKDGSFGLPWPYGRSTGHFSWSGHYKKGSHDSHPAGATLAVVTLSAGTALLDGYEAYGDKRYLVAANRVMSYLLYDKHHGFQWLDVNHRYGSVPYCDLLPVLDPKSKEVKNHNVVPKVKNSSVEVFNIDGTTLRFITKMYKETGDEKLLVYGDAIAPNIVRHMKRDGSIPYSWYEPTEHSTNYAALAFRGLLDYGEMRKRQDWLDAASRGYSWVANTEPYVPASLPSEEFSSAFGIDDLSLDTSKYVQSVITKQRSDGSLSGGSKIRQDAVVFSILARMLRDTGQ